MPTQQPADGESELLFFMDEVAPISRRIHETPRQRPHQTHFQTGEKVRCCAFCHPYHSDVDQNPRPYNTTFIGRFTQPQDVEKVRHAEEAVATRTSLRNFQRSAQANSRWSLRRGRQPVPIQLLVGTERGAPLNEDLVEEIITPEIRA